MSTLDYSLITFSAYMNMFLSAFSFSNGSLMVYDYAVDFSFLFFFFLAIGSHQVATPG